MKKDAHIELLLKKGILSAEQVARAREEVSKTGLPIEKALERLGFIAETDIAKAAADYLGVPFIDLTDYLINAELIKRLPEQVARRHTAIPLFTIGETLTVAIADPLDVVALDEIRLASGARAVDAVLSTAAMIERMIGQYYDSAGNVQEIVAGLTQENVPGRITAEAPLSSEETPVIKLVNLLIVEAFKARASDIHIEPEEKLVRVRYRVDGVLQEAQQIPRHLHSALASRIKVMGKMDIAQSRLPQDGRCEIKIEAKNIDVRISSFPTIHGENIVMRLLDRTSVVLQLGELGMQAPLEQEFEKLIRRPNGIVLVTGPTGSGKTTSLYAALSRINSVEKNILTIEDPVEYELPLIRQTQVNPKAGLSFAEGLRSILRQDPDVIMVGEIRDRETAEIAIQASLTGHLVLSTLHTNDAAGSLTRLIEMGIEPFLIASSVIGIVAQRLVRSVCPKCKAAYVPSEAVLQDLHLSGPQTFYRGAGCAHCHASGLAGRIGIFELLVVNEEVKNRIVSKSSASQIRQAALSAGMTTLFEDGLNKISQGLTTPQEVLRVIEEE